MSRRLEKFLKFQRFCDDLSQLSTCKRSKCGAIIFDWRFTQVVAIGYNGPPTKMSNEACTGEEGQCGCIHAEANALLKARMGCDERYRSLAIYSTMFPCAHCAGLIANSGLVQCVLWKDVYRSQIKSAEILAFANIPTYCVNNRDVIEDALENL